MRKAVFIGKVSKEKLNLQNKQRNKKFRFSFLRSLQIGQESVIRLLPRSVESGITIKAKQAASNKASSKSTQTVLLQISILAKVSEVSEN